MRSRLGTDACAEGLREEGENFFSFSEPGKKQAARGRGTAQSDKSALLNRLMLDYSGAVSLAGAITKQAWKKRTGKMVRRISQAVGESTKKRVSKERSETGCRKMWWLP